MKKFIPGTVWFLIILFFICLPGKDLPKIGWLDRIANFDKAVHFTLFWMLGVLFCWPFYRSTFETAQRIKYFISIAIGVIIMGFMTELIQKFFIYGRNFDLLDWVADALGALLALWFCGKKFSKI